MSRHTARASRRAMARTFTGRRATPSPSRAAAKWKITTARSWPATSCTTSTPQRPTTSWQHGRLAAIHSPRRIPQRRYRTTLGYPATYGKVFNTPSANIPAYNSNGNTFPDFSQASIFENPVGHYAVKKEAPQFGDTLTKVWGTHTIKIGGFTQTTDNYQSSFSYDEDGIMSFNAGQNPDLTGVDHFAGTPIDGQTIGSPHNASRAVCQRPCERLRREQQCTHRRRGTTCRRRASLTTHGRRRVA